MYLLNFSKFRILKFKIHLILIVLKSWRNYIKKSKEYISQKRLCSVFSVMTRYDNILPKRRINPLVKNQVNTFSKKVVLNGFICTRAMETFLNIKRSIKNHILKKIEFQSLMIICKILLIKQTNKRIDIQSLKVKNLPFVAFASILLVHGMMDHLSQFVH